MSELRDQLDRARGAYESARYPGDLGELALAEPPRPNRAWRQAAWGVAIAASLLLAVSLLPEPPSPDPNEPIAATSESTPGRPKIERPKLLAQMGRLERLSRPKRLSINRPKALLRTLSATLTRPPVRLKPATRPTPVGLTTPTTTTPSTPRVRESEPRRRGLASPSFALRSLNDAISLGT